MKRLSWTTVAVAGVFSVLSESPAHAQGPYVPPTVYNPYAQPIISPYINLSRNGSPGIAYFGLVRPELQTSSALQQLELLQRRETTNRSTVETSGIPITGVQSQYMNFSHYYGGRVSGKATLPPLISSPAVTPLATVGPLGTTGVAPAYTPQR